MNIDFKMTPTKIKTKNFGNVEVDINRRNKLGNGYLVTSKVDGVDYSGYIDLDFNEIIPFDRMELVDLFTNKRNNDIAIGFKLEESDILEYYHITKDGKKAKIAYIMGPFDDNNENYSFVDIDSNDYWLLKKDTDKVEYAVYDIKKRKVITDFFDMIELLDEKDSTYHSFFYEKTLTSDIVNVDTDDSSIILHTSICGFLDKDGRFSSEILDEEDEIKYPTYKLGRNTLSKEFKQFISDLYKIYLDRYAEKGEIIDEYINELFENPNILNNQESNQCKILKFNDRK